MSIGLVPIVASALVMALGIADVTRVGRKRFAAAERRISNWILLIIFFGPLAVLLYAAAVRPQVLHPERYADDADDQTPVCRRRLDGVSPAGEHREPGAYGEQAG